MSEEMIPLRKNAKKGLGRGLGSLLGEIEAPTQAAPTPQKTEAPVPVVQTPMPVPSGERIFKLAIEKLQPNKEQPRKTFDPLKLQELSQSIKEKGMILPIVASPLKDGTFQIIAGERRWRAAQAAGMHEVPVIIKSVPDSEALELALIENIQRHDLNPMEEAEAYGILLNKYHLTQAQISERVSKERSTIANLLRLLTLAPEVKMLLKKGEVSLGQAKVLLGLEDLMQQTQMAKKAAQLKLSVRALELQVQRLKRKEEIALEVQPTALNAKQLEPLVSELQKLFGTKVELNPIGKGAKATFYFYSTAELNQFVEKLRKTRT